MLTSNTLRFGTDIFGFFDSDDAGDTGDDESSSGTAIAPTVKRALLQAQPHGGGGWDCRYVTAVNGFNIQYTQPSSSKIRVVFKVEDDYMIFNNSVLQPFAYDASSSIDVLKYGNTVADLISLGSIPGFVGKRIWPVIALQAPSTLTAMPTISIGVVVQRGSEELSRTDESRVIELASSDSGGVPQISSITTVTDKVGNVSLDVKVRVRNADGNWSNYMKFSEVYGLEATAVQFQMTYNVSTTDGSDSATIKKIIIEHTTGETMVSSDGSAYLYSTVADYEVPLQRCYVTVRHSPLNDSEIRAYVNFMHKTKHRDLYKIGTANGSLQTFILGVNGERDPNIVAASVELYAGKSLIDDFAYTSDLSEVRLTAESGQEIYATYDYGHDVETWRRMTLEKTEPFNPKDGSCTSYYSYTLPDEEAGDADNPKTVSNVRLFFYRPLGKVENENLGKTNGKAQLFYLPHIPRASSITFSDSTIQHDFDPESYILTVQGKKANRDIIISYNWIGERVEVYSFTAGWSVA